MSEAIVTFHQRYKPIPKPFAVCRVDDHYLVVTVDDNNEMTDEVSAIHWNKWVVRRWAFECAKEVLNDSAK